MIYSVGRGILDALLQSHHGGINVLVCKYVTVRLGSRALQKYF